jgi:hypothetical protein
MVPRFLRNLLPKPDASGIDKKSFMVGVKSLTLMQVLLYLSGFVFLVFELDERLI